MAVYNYLNDDIVKLVEAKLGSEAETVLREMDGIVSLESVLPPMLDKGKTYGDWGLPALGLYAVGDYRPSEALPIDVIVQMLKSAPVRFALEMKRASVMSVFRNERSWQIHSPDEELAEIVTANLARILPKMALDFSFSSLAYGASFQELVWEYKTKYELGIGEEEANTGTKFVVAKIPNSVNPATIVKINRNKGGHFEGFVQQAKAFASEEITVPREAALVIPYEEKFRNLWGESLLKPMYPIWFWYEVVLRAMVKYMERTGTPVALVKAPSRATIIKPGTKTKVDGITWGMEIASNVSRSNAAVIPSDTDEQGKPLWDLSYLNSTERSQPFLDILELLTQMILRAGLSADRALTQSSGGVGSYAIGQVHQEATALHNELILIQWIHYLNTYFLPLYSLYNRGQNGPPIWIETQGLDPLDRDNLTALLAVAQGMEAFKEVGYRIDWESLLSVNNIPLVSQEDADATKKKQEEQALKKQEDMLATQAKFSTPSPTKQADGSLKANLPNKPAPDKKLEDSDESIIKLAAFNPYRDKIGRFASGPGGGRSAVLGAVSQDEATDAAVVSPKTGFSISPLGIASISAAGLAVAGLVLAKNASAKAEADRRLKLSNYGFTPDQIEHMLSIGISGESSSFMNDGSGRVSVYLKDGTTVSRNIDKNTSLLPEEILKAQQDLVDKRIDELGVLLEEANINIDNLSDEEILSLNPEILQSRIDALKGDKIDILQGEYQFKDLPEFKSKEDVDKFLVDQYAAIGIDLDPSKIRFTTDQEGLWGNVEVDENGNPRRIVNIQENIFNDLFGPDEGARRFALHALAHEYGHSLQGFGQGDDNSMLNFYSRPSDNDDLYRIEGGAELYARLALSDFKTNSGPDYREYTKSTGIAAGLVSAYIKKNNADLTSSLSEFNSNIASNRVHYQYLKSLFPERMGDRVGTNSIPNQATIERWLKQDYNIESEVAMDDLMAMALSRMGN